MHAWLWMRLACGLLAAVSALHLIIIVDTQLGWKLTLAAGEYGHRIAVVCLLLLFVGVRGKSWLTHTGTLLLLVSALVLVWPLMQAKSLADQLPSQLDAAFGSATQGGEEQPVSFDGLWFGAGPAPKEPETHVYVNDADGARRLYFFKAEGRTPAPCLIVIHGGGWENGDAREFPEWNAWWSSQGFAVAAVQYRLAPRHRWPAPREDVQQALEWLKAHAQRLGIDPQRFVLLGRSAGGQIATACAYGLRDPAIVGCIAVYAPHDLFFARRFAFEDDVLGSLRLLRNYLGGDPAEAEPAYASASGFMLARPSSCPTLHLHGTRDTLVWNMQGRRLAQRLQRLGVKHLHLELPWAQHGFDWPFHGPGAHLARHAIDGFLLRVAAD